MLNIILSLTAISIFPISEAFQDQNYPVALSVQDLYYVFWYDMRYYAPYRSIFSCRITSTGDVLDPQGIEILRDQAEWSDAAFDGTNFLVVTQDSC